MKIFAKIRNYSTSKLNASFNNNNKERKNELISEPVYSYCNHLQCVLIIFKDFKLFIYKR